MAMTFTQLQDEVLNHGFDESYRARVKNWLNEAQGRVARYMQVPDFEAPYSVFTTPQNPTFSLPADFVRLVSLNNLTTLRCLDPSTPQLLDAYPARSGEPLVFALDPAFDAVRLYPTPDQAYELRLRYFASPTAMSDTNPTSAIPADYTDLLVTYALSRAFRAEDDYEAANFFSGQFTVELQKAATDLQYRDTTTKQVPGIWSY